MANDEFLLVVIEVMTIQEKTNYPEGFYYEVSPLECPQCGAEMKIVTFITEYSVVDRIVNHLKLSFIAERPPPPHLFYQQLSIGAEEGGEYF